VLTARGIAYTRSDKVPALVTRAQRSLALSAKGVSDEAPALRQILQSLVTLAQGVTEIRNLVGVDHGAESVLTRTRRGGRPQRSREPGVRERITNRGEQSKRPSHRVPGHGNHGDLQLASFRDSASVVKNPLSLRTVAPQPCVCPPT